MNGGCERTPVLFVNFSQARCGVFQYGRNLCEALGSSTRYRVDRLEVQSLEEVDQAVARGAYAALLFNYHPQTLTFLKPDLPPRYAQPCLAIMHEMTQAEADAMPAGIFQHYVMGDPTLVENNPGVFKTGRLVLPYAGPRPEPAVATIGAFGFSVGSKGYDRVVEAVQAEFDQALIRLHLPPNDIIDRDGSQARGIAERCRRRIRKPGIRLEASHRFLDRDELLGFLAGNTLNAMLYDQLPVAGISSSPDLAMAVRKPIAITRTIMFRHLWGVRPSLCVEDSSLRKIIAHGSAPYEHLLALWSPARLVREYESILDRVLSADRARYRATPTCAPHPALHDVPTFDHQALKRHYESPASASRRARDTAHAAAAADRLRPAVARGTHPGVAGVKRLNRILDNQARALYQPAVDELLALVPETMAAKIPAANVQQAFVYDTVLKLAPGHGCRILCVGSQDDSACAALRRLGFDVAEVDPAVNGLDLDQFVALPDTRPRSYDLVFSTSVLEHVADDARFVAQIAELLKPGGTAILTCDYKDPQAPGEPIIPGDHRWYTQRDLLERVLPAMRDCELLDPPQWACPSPDFQFVGHRYTFASVVVRKACAPARVRARPGRLPRGLFLNSPAAPCSIHESGRMFFDAVAGSTRVRLDYAETKGGDALPAHYDFYLFNYHHVTMAALTEAQVRALPGWKATFVLEMEPGDPFVLTPRWFDAYLVPDPTLRVLDPRVFPFPRPLERAPSLPPWQEPTVPVIGSFGFATPGKGFDRVVRAVNAEFAEAVVRLNIPFAQFGDPEGTAARQMAAECAALARPGVRVAVSHEFLDKPALIRWCAQNTLNCFFYHRRQPGLSATTDQAISAGRPLLVSDCDTFRHIHAYVPPHPQWRLRDAIARSLPAVQRMQEDWAPERFQQRLEEVLEQALVLRRPAASAPVEIPRAPAHVPAAPRTRRARVLFVSHVREQCGIQQYGREVVDALRGSTRIEVESVECEDAEGFRAAASARNWDAFVHNYYPVTMPWLCSALIHAFPGAHLGILHEVNQTEADAALGDLFDAWIAPDPTLRTANPRVFSTGRLVPAWRGSVPLPERTTIGTFGFGVQGKGLARLLLAVQEEFDDAVVRMHLPGNAFVDPDGALARQSVAACRALIRKPDIELQASHDFKTPDQLLQFLAGNSLNAFCYDHGRDRGISSALEKALAVNRPIAITRSGMFRHVWDAQPSICLEDRSLGEILATGTAPLRPFQAAWTAANLVRDYEAILDAVLAGVPA